jgi:hypothetical protein
MFRKRPIKRKNMNIKIQRVLMALTLVNLVVLTFLLTHQTKAAESHSTAPVLRGRALEIVDENGNVRAAIQLIPGRADGTFPETVILRLIDAKGKPLVKIGGSAQGSALSLVGDNDGTYVVLKAEADTSLKMLNKNGKEQIIKP